MVDAACIEVGAHAGLLETVLTSTLQSPQYVSTVNRFDLVILVCLHSAPTLSESPSTLSRKQLLLLIHYMLNITEMQDVREKS